MKRFETLTDAHLIEQVPVEPLDPAVAGRRAAEIAQMRVEPALYQYIVAVIRRTRDWPALSLGASPRAAIGLFFVSRAHRRHGRPRLPDSRRRQSCRPGGPAAPSDAEARSGSRRPHCGFRNRRNSGRGRGSEVNSTPTLIPAVASAQARSTGRFKIGLGKRFFVALLIGMVWAVPSAWSPRLIAGMFVWDGIFHPALASGLAAASKALTTPVTAHLAFPAVSRSPFERDYRVAKLRPPTSLCAYCR